MLRAQPEGHADLGLGLAAGLADIDRLCAQLPAMSHWTRRRREELAAQTRVFDVQPGAAIVRQGHSVGIDAAKDVVYFGLGRTAHDREGENVIQESAYLLLRQATRAVVGAREQPLTSPAFRGREVV